VRALRRLTLHPGDLRPIYVVWELTLACDQPCTHCGSRAGEARAHEIGRARALEVVKELAAMGAEEVVLIGGEAYLHDAFIDVIAALREAGIRPTMTTGGRGVTPDLARAMKSAGMYSVSVSIDGVEATHDLMRACRGSFASATAALDALHDAGITVAANTNVNRLNVKDLESLYEHLRAHHVRSWQVQLTAPLGRAADRADMLLQPWDLIELVPRVAALKKRGYAEGILLMPGNNLGYFDPDEALLRGATEDGRDHFQGCTAGRFVLGIESDGAVKGCPSLQTKHYVGGNVHERSVATIWSDAPELAFTRTRTKDALWGFCATCPFAEPCMGGCTFTAHAIMGRPGNNPYCSFRARTMAARGLRERLVPALRAPGDPFDNGRFDIVVEPFDAPDERPARPNDLVKLRRAPS
jgi:radical SAM protein with 4Fe4S-binding SPASM domain